MIIESEKPRLIEKSAATYIDESGAIRWESSNNVVSADIINFWYGENMITSATVAISVVERAKDANKAFDSYCYNNARVNVLKELRACEQRAAFEKCEPYF